MSLVPLGKGDIIFGRPLPWSIYDREGNLLLRRGHVIESRMHFEALLQQELYRGGEPRLALVQPHGPTTPQKVADGGTTNERIETLESVKLHIGDTLQLQSQANEGATRHYVRLIGYVKDRSVLVTTPAVDGKICLMREGQSFVVRAFSGRNAYAFTASIFKVANTPFPHLHLSYPHEVRSARVRKDCRVNTSIIAAVGAFNSAQAGGTAATITNLSVGGALLMAPKRLGRKGDKLSVKFRLALHDIEVYLTVDALVRSADHGTTGDQAAAFSHGIQFVDVPEQHVVALTAYVYHMLADESAAA